MRGLTYVVRIPVGVDLVVAVILAHAGDPVPTLLTAVSCHYRRGWGPGSGWFVRISTFGQIRIPFSKFCRLRIPVFKIWSETDPVFKIWSDPDPVCYKIHL